MAQVKIPPPHLAYDAATRKRALALLNKQGCGPVSISKELQVDIDVIRFWIYGGDGKARTGKRKYNVTNTHHDWWVWKSRNLAANLSKIGNESPTAKQLEYWMREYWGDHDRAGIDHMQCYYCATMLTSNNLQIDHKQPHTRGGPNHVTNLAMSCKGCNQAKGDMNETEFCELLDTVYRWHDEGKSILSRLRASTQIYATRRWK